MGDGSWVDFGDDLGIIGAIVLALVALVVIAFLALVLLNVVALAIELLIIVILVLGGDRRPGRVPAALDRGRQAQATTCTRRRSSAGGRAAG